MDPNTAFLQILDRYGPLGAALFVVSIVLVAIIWKVIPDVTESHGKRLDALIAAFKEGIGGFNSRLETHEAKSAERHVEVLGNLKEIRRKLPPVNGDDKQ